MPGSEDLDPASADGSAPGSTGAGFKIAPVTRQRLEQSANNWLVLGVLFLLLAAGGAVALGITLAPTKATTDFLGNASTETDTGAGVAIGFGVFVGSLVTILPYFFFSRVMRVFATLVPPDEE